MGVQYNSRIVTDSLVLALDAANPKNYNLTAVEVLVVAGGGSGGVDNGGGGGAGGLIYNSNFAVTPGSALTVTVGAGGAARAGASDDGPGNNGGNSVFGSLTTYGGGGGSGWTNTALPPGSSAYTGGSGAGQSASTGSGNSLGAGTGNRVTGTTTVAAGQGNNGGTAVGGFAGGGGGAGGPGGNASSGNAGAGGLGYRSSISGTQIVYAAGGAGGWDVASGYSSTLPFTENGTVKKTTQTAEDACPANTGHGGNGGNHNNNSSGAGGSGIVIVRYPGPQRAIGGTVTSVGGHTIHTFTTVGSTTFTPLVATNNSTILGLADFSGNNNFGTTANSPVYSSSFGGSVSFDGTNEYVEIVNNNGFGEVSTTPTITLELWANIVRKSGGGTQYQQLAGFRNDIDFSFFFLLLDASGASVNTEARIQTTSGVFDVVASYLPYFNVWTHIVFTANVNRIDLYFNGNLVGSNTNVTGSFGSTSGNFRVGLSPGGAWSTLGNISSVKVYNRALTAAEIQQNFNATRGRFGI
jgi:hypothetical protein